MRALVTGANGFLGRHVVAALRARGHDVRALVRPTASFEVDGETGVDVVRADLRRPGDLGPALADVDVVVHLAAATSGSDEAQFASTVAGTERLLRAMSEHGVRRIVLASSFSVYDWEAVGGRLDERAPLAAGDALYGRDGYAVAKLWQERVVRRWCEQNGGELTVLRPGYIWGPGMENVSGVGADAGPLHVVIGPLRRLPLTHVVNCADCFALAAEHPEAIGQTFNVVDPDGVHAWRFLGDYLSRARAGARSGGVRLMLPYRLGLWMARLASAVSRVFFGRTARLPGLLVPSRYEARFKPTPVDTTHLRDTLGWRPPLSYPQCLERTWSGSDA